MQDALAVSDVVISAVPHKDYKVKTEWLKDGCVCVNVAGDKNFEADVRDKVSVGRAPFCFVNHVLMFRRTARPRSMSLPWGR